MCLLPKSGEGPFVCQCNSIRLGTIMAALKDHKDDLHTAETLLDATGRVYQCARDRTTGAPSQNPCATCFGMVASNIKKQTGLFEGEKLPDRMMQGDCPRRAKALMPVSTCTCCG